MRGRGIRPGVRALWADQPLAVKGLVVVALPLAVLLTALITLHLSARAEARAEADVRAAFAIQRDIHQVHALLAEAASGVRGYLISREDRFLAPYREAEARLPATLARLDGQIRDPEIRRRFEIVRGLAGRKREGLSDLLAGAAAGGDDGARVQVGLDANKAVLDALRVEIDAMQAREATLLNQRLERADRVRARSLTLTALCAGLGILGSLGAVYLFTVGIVGRVRRLERNAGLLERGEPLEPLPEEADELGRLARRMDEAGRLLRAREQALKDSEERFRLVVEGVRDYGIFALDPQGRVVSWNTGAERIKGWSAEEILGRHFSTFYPDDTRPTLPGRMLARAEADGRAEDEGWRLRKDGTLFWANVVITALRDDTGRLRGFSKVTRDITDRRRAEEALRAAEAAAVTANAAKSAFLSRTSHELQTPLGAILGFAQLLDMDRATLAPDQVAAVEQIRSAGHHLVALIDDVLDISSIESGQLALDVQPLDLSSVIDEALGLLQGEIEARDLTVHRTTVPPGRIRGDRRRMLQVLLNLLSNAAKYNRRGGRIELDVRMTRDTMTVDIQDQGQGLAASDADRVFSPFDRLGQERLGRAKGTGLGLALSRQLVEAMGGAIGYGPRRDGGAGTLFWVHLPRARDDLSIATDTAAHDRP